MIALSVWWFSVPQIVGMLTADVGDDDTATRRAALVDMVRRLTGSA